MLKDKHRPICYSQFFLILKYWYWFIDKSSISQAQVFMESQCSQVQVKSKYLTFSLCDHANTLLQNPSQTTRHSVLLTPWIWTARGSLSGNEQCVSWLPRAGPELTCPYARPRNLAPMLHHLLLSFVCVCVWVCVI